MINQKKNLQRTWIVLCIILGMAGLTACSNQEHQEQAEVLEFTKDGKLMSFISENFTEEYYEKDEMQQIILQEVAEYNKEKNDAISVEKIDMKDTYVTVNMTYASAADYATYNDVYFFEGTVKEAQDAGIELNVVFSSVKDEQDTISKADIFAMDGYRIIVTDITETIVLKGKAVYGKNVQVDKDMRTVKKDKDEDGLAYILYK